MKNASTTSLYQRLISIPVWVYGLAALSFLAALAIAPSAKLVPEVHAAQNNVSMVGMTFSPATITIAAGDTVMWMNNSSMPHTVTADDGSFDSGTVGAGGMYSHTFMTPGTYRYYCRFHGAQGGVGMSGTITVTGPSQPLNPNPVPNPMPSTMPNPNMNFSQPTQTTMPNMQMNTYPPQPSYPPPQRQSNTSPASLYYSPVITQYPSNYYPPNTFSSQYYPQTYSPHRCNYVSYSYYPYLSSYTYGGYGQPSNYRFQRNQTQYYQSTYQQPYSYANQYTYSSGAYPTGNSYSYPQQSSYNYSYMGY